MLMQSPDPGVLAVGHVAHNGCRRLIPLTSMVIWLLFLIACGGGDSRPPSPTPTPSPTAVPTPSLSLSPDQRANYLIGYMTQQEKLQLVRGYSEHLEQLPYNLIGFVPGIPRLSIPDLRMANATVGVGLEANIGEATALPSGMAIAATWDLDLAYEYGDVIGSDLRPKGINVALGGNVNLSGREPRVGRAFEMKGEDPILSGRINAEQLRAIQTYPVIAGIKHFAVNDQETGRQMANVIIAERALRETDLLAFEIGVKDSNLQSVMCAYNLVNGIYSCENDHLLNEILKDEWGFQGFVMSDWWATFHPGFTEALGANSGLDMEMPGPSSNVAPLETEIQAGRVTQARIDDMVHRILRALLVVGAYDHPPVQETLNADANLAVAQRVAEQGTVLLKNTNAQLPLSSSAIGTCVAVIGEHADYGVMSGGGSGRVWPIGGTTLTFPAPNPPGWGLIIWDPPSPLAAITARVGSSKVRFSDGTNHTTAANLAAGCDVAVVFPYEWQSEAMDHPTLNFTRDQDALIADVAAVQPHTVVVLETGGAIAMPWIDDVSAVLAAWYPGQRGAEAIAEILFGDVNPSGKSPISFPASTQQLPHPTIAGSNDATAPFDVNYSEGLQVGYKWFDQQGIEPLFPFGYGLSYTTFSINAASVDVPAANQLAVSFDLTNTGARAGSEVAQLYLGMPASLGEPPRRLIGWQKVSLNAGAQQRVIIAIDADSSAHPLSFWDESTGAWRIADGSYTLYLGNSSRSLVDIATLRVNGGVFQILQ